MSYQPFMCNSSIKKYEDLIFNGAKILELGAGYSTLWLAEKDVFVESYEHNPTWFENMNRMLKSEQIDVHLHESYDNAISEYPQEYFDIIVVDGINRLECVENIYESKVLKIGGYLLIDDIERRFHKMGDKYDKMVKVVEGWECECIADYPFETFEEYSNLEKEVRPQKLKQTLFAKRTE